jgi:ferrous-iron efflux pump FieF
MEREIPFPQVLHGRKALGGRGLAVAGLLGEVLLLERGHHDGALGFHDPMVTPILRSGDGAHAQGEAVLLDHRERDGGRARDRMATMRLPMASRLLLASSLVSLALLVALTLAWLATGSTLALAQAADSVSDALTGLGLLWALRVSRRPPDADHHYGHHGAQPIAALVVAMLVGVLALEVLREAIAALREDAVPALGWPVAAALGTKVAIKLVFVKLASNAALLRSNATLRAFRVDAASDAVVGVVSLLGLAGATWGGVPSLDAWLALPVAVWIGVSGFGLARESIELLMGTAPPPAWQAELKTLVAGMPGVRGVTDLRARSFGDRTHVWVEIRVDPELTVGRAHDLGEAVEERLLEREGICDAVVHVDAAVDGDAPREPAP